MSDKPESKIVSAVGVSVGSSTVRGVGQAFARPRDDHEVYNLVGRVSSEWAHLEHMLDIIIWDLAGIDPPKGACVTAQMMGVWPRINTIVALLTNYELSIPTLKPFIRKINKFGDDCRGPSDHRNRIIHDPWYSEQHDENLVAQHRSMPKGNLTYGLEDTDKAEFATLLSEIDALSKNATEIKNAIRAMLIASR